MAIPKVIKVASYATIKTKFKTTLCELKSSAPKFARAARGLLPVFGAVGSGVALYFGCPEVKEAVDDVRVTLVPYGNEIEALTAGVVSGALADYSAQRYEGKNFDGWRFAGMIALNVFCTRCLTRPFYNLQEDLFPTGTPHATLNRILLDQGPWMPIYYFVYLLGANLISAHNNYSRLTGIFSKVRSDLVKSIPRGWLFWGGFALPIVYNLPSDLKVMAAITFSYFWCSFLSRLAHDK